MKRFVVLLGFLTAGASFAQGIIPRALALSNADESIILATAENAFRVPFVEVDREIPNAEFVMRMGILEEERARFVLITPTTIHAVERSGDEVTYSTPEWDDRMFTSASSRFNRISLTGEGEGATMKPAPYVPGPNYRAGPNRWGSSYTPSSSRSSTYSCTSSSTSNSSTMTCRTNGRITSTSTCRLTGYGSTRTMTCTSNRY